jgi:hypothetical protein
MKVKVIKSRHMMEGDGYPELRAQGVLVDFTTTVAIIDLDEPIAYDIYGRRYLVKRVVLRREWVGTVGYMDPQLPKGESNGEDAELLERAPGEVSPDRARQLKPVRG